MCLFSLHLLVQPCLEDMKNSNTILNLKKITKNPKKKVYKFTFKKIFMDSIIKKIFTDKVDEEVHNQFIRFGKGNYKKRFQISFNKTKKIKIKSSFEFANDLVRFIIENKDVNYSGNILTKSEVPGKSGKKKAGSFVYELSNEKINEFEDVFFYLLDVQDEEIVLKIKKKLPKPGKNENKIDNKFCVLELDLKYWDKVKEVFFWDVSDVKKASIEHELIINDIEIPKNEKDPVKMREKAIRKGKIVRIINIDGKEERKKKDFGA